MKKLIVHIGMGKTGSSSIQRFLVENQAVLNRAGYAYPDYNGSFFDQEIVASGRYSNGMFYTFLHGQQMQEGFEKIKWDNFIGQLKEDLGNRNVILSDEAIYGRGIDYFHYLKSLNVEIKCCVYLRRQDMRMESLYAQNIKGATYFSDNEVLDFVNNYSAAEYCRLVMDKGGNKYDFFDHLMQFEKILGKENLYVFTYEEAREYGLCKHFSENVLGMDYSDFSESCRLNVSPSLTDIEAKRRLNMLLKEYPVSAGVMMQRIYNQIPFEKSDGGNRWLTPEMRREILEFYKNQNEKTAEHFFGRQQLFEDTIDCKTDEPEKEEINAQYIKLLEMLVIEMLYHYSHSSWKDMLPKKKKIVLFGAGGMCRQIMDHGFVPAVFILDNDKNKEGMQVGGMPVVWAGDFHDWQDYFYIVTPLDYKAIEKQLIANGVECGTGFKRMEWESKLIPSLR